MQDALRVIDTDFRDCLGPYDKVVSIGVLEHAGRDQLEEVVRAHAAFLKPGGLGMLHFIGHVGRRDTEFFIREHVFPGGWIPSLADVIVAMEDSGLEIVDIENLRRHYAHTLDAWTERFDRNWDRIHAIDPAKFNERFRRTWRTYLVSCAEMFRSPIERTHLFQIVFSKGNITEPLLPDEPRLPLPGARRSGSMSGYAERRGQLLAALGARRHGSVGIAKDTSNLFATAHRRGSILLDVRAFDHVLAVDPGRSMGRGRRNDALRRDRCAHASGRRDARSRPATEDHHARWRGGRSRDRGLVVPAWARA
jgi:hypothetical protein